MISRRDSNKNLKKTLIYSSIVVFVVFAWSPFKSFTLPLLEATGFFSSQVYSFFSGITHKIYLYAASNESLYEENVRLNNELTEEKLHYIELATLKNDIEKYEGLAEGFSQSFFAKRIGTIDTFVHDTFRINKGSGDNVLPGTVVVGLGNVVLGTISEVGNKTSLVALLWNGNQIVGRVSVNGAVITLTGVDDGVYKAEVSHEMNFQIGDVILYDNNPRLVLGIVRKIHDNESDQFKEILIHIPFHPSMIDVVRIDPKV